MPVQAGRSPLGCRVGTSRYAKLSYGAKVGLGPSGNPGCINAQRASLKHMAMVLE